MDSSVVLDGLNSLLQLSLLILRTLIVRAIAKNPTLSMDAKRRWVVWARNTMVFVLLVGLVVIWTHSFGAAVPGTGPRMIEDRAGDSALISCRATLTPVDARTGHVELARRIVFLIFRGSFRILQNPSFLFATPNNLVEYGAAA